MYMYKYLYGIYVNVYYNLIRSLIIVIIVLNIVRVDGWGICCRIKLYNGLLIIILRCLSVLDLILSLFVLYFFLFLLCIVFVDMKCVYI